MPRKLVSAIIRHLRELSLVQLMMLAGVYGMGLSTPKLIAHFSTTKAVLADQSPAQHSVPVATEAAQKRKLENYFSTNAFLQPKKEVTLHPGNNVTVREVKVEVGQIVKKGEVLAYTDSEMQSLRGELDHIDAEMRDMDFNVTVALAKKSYMAKNEFKQKQLEHRAGEIRKRIAAIESEGALISPIAGVVSEIALKTGDYVDNSTQYFIKIADSSTYRIQLYLPQTIASRLKKGMLADLSRPNSIGDEQDPGVHKAGQVSAIAPVVDPKTGSVQIEIELLKVPEGWISGMYVHVTISIENVDSAISVPTEALIFEKSQAYVYRVQSPPEEATPRAPSSENTAAEAMASPHAQKVAVQVGLRNGKYTEIKSGVEEFDLIVVEGQSSLADGAPVQVIR